MARAITIIAALLIMPALVGGMIFVSFAQAAKEPAAELYVRTLPAGAMVLVDGKRVGTSDNLFEVEPGERKIEVELDGYEPRSKKVTVPDERIKRVVFKLKQQAGKAPRPAKTIPKIGATDVDPGLRKIRVTFDRDMKVGGHSWCGGGPHFPKVTGRPKWIGRRTCVLPVKLEKGKAYRLALNWGRFNNFRSADGKPAIPTALYFCTRGASPQLVAQMTPPKVVKLSIENGAKDVPPGRTRLSVTFDQAMGGGMSWCTGPNTPKYEPVKGSPWSADKKTCSLHALLEPGRSYTITLNDEQFGGNFKNPIGVSLKPTVWKFTTAD